MGLIVIPRNFRQDNTSTERLVFQVQVSSLLEKARSAAAEQIHDTVPSELSESIQMRRPIPPSIHVLQD
jgi:hypothetical protein